MTWAAGWALTDGYRGAPGRGHGRQDPWQASLGWGGLGQGLPEPCLAAARGPEMGRRLPVPENMVTRARPKPRRRETDRCAVPSRPAPPER